MLLGGEMLANSLSVTNRGCFIEIVESCSGTVMVEVTVLLNWL